MTHHCRNCRCWEHTIVEVDRGPGWGVCLAVRTTDSLACPTPHQRPEGRVRTGDEMAGTLVTHARYGCVMWESKDE